MLAIVETRPLHGEIAAIPSKSQAHRLLICAALCDSPTHIEMRSVSEDVRATANCLAALGAGVEFLADGVRVSPMQRLPEEALLDCGESGSTLRFLLPVAAALGVPARFTGRGRLPERPIGPLREALEQQGLQFSSDRLPFSISGRLRAGEYALPGGVSSQFISGLLLALPLLEGKSRIRVGGALESAPYVHMTLAALQSFGVAAAEETEGYSVAGAAAFRTPGRLRVEGDWSNAAFFLCAGALGQGVRVSGLRADSLQGDRAVMELLGAFGADVRMDGDRAQVRPGFLRAMEVVDMRAIPDLLPVLAVVAAFAEGETRFVNAARLRLKESDRLESTAAMLRALGARAEVFADALHVGGVGLHGGTVESFGDHRIAMAAAVAAAGCREPVQIRSAQCVAKSYPDFFADYRKAGGAVYVL